MKLKKSEPEVAAPAAAPQQGRAAIAARFQLDGDPNAKKAAAPGAVGRTAAMIALICSLLAIATLGVITWMLYTNWELIREV